MAKHSVEFKIGADVSDFEKGIKASEKDVKSLQKSAEYLQKGLSIKFDSTSFAEAQKQLQSALSKTNERIIAIKQEMATLEKSGKVDTSDYDRLSASLAKAETNAKELEERLKEVNRAKFDSLASQFTKVGDSITKAGQSFTALSAVAAAALAAVYKLTSSAAENAQQIYTLSAEYSLSAQEVQKWSYVATQSGVSAESLYKGFQKLQTAMGDMKLGNTSSSAQALSELGIDMKSFGNDTDAAMKAVIEALGNMSDKTEAAAIASKIFGDEASKSIMAVASQGSAAIDEYVSEYDSMGGVTDESLSALNDLKQAFDRFKLSFLSAAENLAAKLAPAIERIMSELEGSLIPIMDKVDSWLSKLSASQVETILKILAVVAAVAPLLLVVGKAVSAIGSMISSIGGLNAAFSALAANPIVLIIAAVVALLVLCYKNSEKFRESVNGLFESVSSAMGPILSEIGSLLGALASSFAPILEEIGNLLAPIIDVLGSVLSSAISFISPLLEILSPIIGFITMITSMISSIVSQALKPVVDFIESKVVPTITKISSVVSGVINTIKGWIVSAINWIIDKYNAVAEWINGVIDGMNSAFGTSIGHIAEAEKISLGEDSASSSAVAATSTSTTSSTSSSTTNNITNDNSTKNITVNVSVDSLDSKGMSLDELGDELANAVNLKLAGSM